MALSWLNMIYPLECVACATTVASGLSLCPDCWSTVPFVTEHHCPSCAMPVEKGSFPCPACCLSPPPYTRLSAVFYYAHLGRTLIHRFKYADGTYLSEPFARWILRNQQDTLSTIDYFVPVPTHWKRLWQRRYNQAALLTLQLHRLSQIPHLPTALARIKATDHQTYLHKKERMHNVSHAFTVPEAMQRVIANRSLMLVDDVVTTGATVTACTNALLMAGAASVRVVTVARTNPELG